MNGQDKPAAKPKAAKGTKSTSRPRKRPADSQLTSSLAAKKQRKNCKKVKGDEKFLEITEKDRQLFDIDYPLNVCLDKRNVREFIDNMRTKKIRPKINIQITEDFAMTVQNVVMTVELRNKTNHYRVPPLPSFSPAPPSRHAKEEEALDDDGGIPSMFTSPLKMMSTTGTALTLDDILGDDADNLMIDEDVKQSKEKGKKKILTGEEYSISLNELTLYWRHYGAQHNNRRFTAVILRNHELSAASLVFGSGNFVCTGCDRPETALWLLHGTLEKLEKAGYENFEIPDPQLRNIVSSGRFPNTLCTSLLAVLFSGNCTRAEKFPGTMIFHPDIGKRVILAFDSGKLCHSGAHSPDEVVHDIKVVYPMLVRCQYTVQNQKDDELCSRILNVNKLSPKRLEAVKQMRNQIETEYARHKTEVQEKRTKSAQMRAIKLRENKQKKLNAALNEPLEIVLTDIELSADEPSILS